MPELNAPTAPKVKETPPPKDSSAKAPVPSGPPKGAGNLESRKSGGEGASSKGGESRPTVHATGFDRDKTPAEKSPPKDSSGSKPVATQPGGTAQQGANQPGGTAQQGATQPGGTAQQGANQPGGTQQQGANQPGGTQQQGANQPGANQPSSTYTLDPRAHNDAAGKSASDSSTSRTNVSGSVDMSGAHASASQSWTAQHGSDQRNVKTEAGVHGTAQVGKNSGASAGGYAGVTGSQRIGPVNASGSVRTEASGGSKGVEWRVVAKAEVSKDFGKSSVGFCASAAADVSSKQGRTTESHVGVCGKYTF